MKYIDELEHDGSFKQRVPPDKMLEVACAEVDSLRIQLIEAKALIDLVGSQLEASAEDCIRENAQKEQIEKNCLQIFDAGAAIEKQLRARLAVADAALAAAVSKAQLNLAINRSCSCGGRPPGTPSTCPACEVWHRLFGDLAPPKPVPIDAALHPATKEST